MNKLLLQVLLTVISTATFAQQTAIYKDPREKFNEAKEYFQKEQYSLAYPILKELRSATNESTLVNYPVSSQELAYYTITCALKQDENLAEQQALTFIESERNNARVQMMSFQLGEFYFRRQDFGRAVGQYEDANIANLSNADIATMKFHQGYSYFTLQRFDRAKPLFNTIRSMPGDRYYKDANYYYGFLAFRDKQYTDALASFKIVEEEKDYAGVVPYYIAQIYYIQGKKEEALAYAEKKIRSGNSQYYDLEMKQMIGHAYFEKGDFKAALPYLADFVKSSPKVRREDLYELSYSYYMAGQTDQAIEGFKQLSGKQDSLSQSAMYLLGDAYLKKGQKANARNAFLFCASNSSDARQQEISRFQYAKLSFELGYQDEALTGLRSFLTDYPSSNYSNEAKDLLVGVLTNTNNYREALSLLEGLSNPTPNAKRLYPRILYGRATELVNDGRLAEAEALLDKALKDPNNAPVLALTSFWKGEIAYRGGRIDDAIKYYNAYADAGSPESGEANVYTVRYNLGYCYLKKENYPVALSFFESLAKNPALNSDELTQDAYIRTADCYYMQRNYARAKPMYATVIRLSWPAEDYATYQEAMIGGINNSKEKISLLNTMVRKFPQSPLVTDATMEIANTYLADEKFGEAIPFLNKVVEATGNASAKPEALLKLGIAYYNLNNSAAALQQYNKLVSQYPNSPEAADALDNVKLIYVEEGKPDEYAAFMRNAGKPLSISTEDSLTFASAENQFANNNTNAALTGFSNYLQKFPQGAYIIDAEYYRAEIYTGKRDWKNALPGYEMVARNAPNEFAERAILEAARIYFFELKDYARAETYYTQLNQEASAQENKLEAMRGLLRSQYQLKKYAEAAANAKALAAAKGASSDDRALASMTLGKSFQLDNDHTQAINNFKNVVSLNKAALAAEARYEIGASWFALKNLNEAEKGAFEVINKSGSYDYWVTKAYILLGDVYYAQKDFFNAKATFQSIVDHATDAELKNEAQQKLTQTLSAESANSRLNN